jgi:chloramphenicol-sensitive protein RarD
MNKGILYTLASYLMWGFFPIYFKMLESVPAQQTTAHRIVWSFLFLLLILTLRKELSNLRKPIPRRTFLVYTLAAMLLAVNWLAFVYGVTHGYVIETSLGYFINPLVSVLLGVVILHEKLRPMQWVPVGLAAVGVIYLTVSYGTLPWLALVLAVTFGLYGLVQKTAPLETLQGLTLETGIIFLPSLAVLLLAERGGTGAFGHMGWSFSLLMAFSGVLTVIPLWLFTMGVRIVPLSVAGLLQYISPTLQFLIGVYLFNEPFTHTSLVGFSIIWLALIIFSFEIFLNQRRPAPAASV